MMRKLLIVGAALWATSLTGCDLYYGTPNDRNCDLWGCQDETWPETDPVDPGDECTTDEQCAAGCYCDNPPGGVGVCVETGFCDTDNDCPGDMVCDDRATCVPDDGCDPNDGTCNPPPDDCSITGCANGEYCDLGSGQCVPSIGCTINDECGPGFECAPDGTCVPVACDGDDACLPGCICDPDSGQCLETGFCDADEDCMDICDADGNCEPAVCDPVRNTCVPGTPPPPPPVTSCGGPITCAVAAPTCAAGETPEIFEGCYTGGCLVEADCDVPAPALCHEIQNPSQCINRPDCEVQYDGFDCTCEGAPCDCSDPPLDPDGNPIACTCSTWEESCQSV